jgi:hypothetical protein
MWLSPQEIPRRSEGIIQRFNDPEWPGCSSEASPEGCQLPDVRYVNTFRSHAIKSLLEERFVDLGALDAEDAHTYCIGNPICDDPNDPHDGPNDERVFFHQNYYFKDECYWAGVYFMYKDKHQALVAYTRQVAASYSDPTEIDACNMSCDAHRPEITNP